MEEKNITADMAYQLAIKALAAAEENSKEIAELRVEIQRLKENSESVDKIKKAFENFSRDIIVFDGAKDKNSHKNNIIDVFIPLGEKDDFEKLMKKLSHLPDGGIIG